MDKSYIASLIDHAVLKPEATYEDLKSEAAVAIKYNVASLCVKPCYVAEAKELLSGTKVLVCTVMGFPHGSNTTGTKLSEASEAIQNGAKELDMVINIAKLVSGDYEYVKKDIKAIADITHANACILKVILETALLNEELIKTASRLSEEAGADFIKTSTGFNGRGASLGDIETMKNSVSQKVKIKASGGIKNFEQAVAFAEVGCTRLGTSSTLEIMGENKVQGNY
jgi:deoxyribose-phosphate aldolase